MPASDAAIAKRLVALGDEGLGGFSAWGEDDEGVFLLRRIPSRTLDGLGKGERLDGLGALAKVRDLARALAAAEKAGIFPGPLRTAEVALGSTGRAEAFVLAESYVRSRFADAQAKAGASSGPSPRWTPPEQARGAPWDNAANRYVLGLVAYRLLAGAHPFSGVGLRDAIDAQTGAPPPFDEAIARDLKPGIQSFVLTMLDPDPGKRPASAAQIAARCDAILRGELAPSEARSPGSSAPAPRRSRAVASEPSKPSDASRERPVAATVASPPPASRRWLAAAPIAVGLLVGLFGVASSPRFGGADPAPSASGTTRIRASEPLATTTAESCAPCHARQVSEWKRSVMAYSAKSPLFGALESVVEEQVGRDQRLCPNGAGVLRKVGADSCRDEKTNLTFTGSGGEHWCVNCHAATDNLKTTMPGWNARGAAQEARKPLRDLLSPQAMEGISCALCHTTIGPVHAGSGGYQGNPSWSSTATGTTFRMRPEDTFGLEGIANSGYLLDAKSFLANRSGAGGAGDPIVHRATPADTKKYLGSSEFCGACHDVRLFGTDSIGVRERGEHFKRLRNAYSEWRSWADTEKAAGRKAASCQDCHMSLYPGVCLPGEGERGGCPQGFHFAARAPGEKARGPIAASSTSSKPITTHYFTSVDVPLTPEFPEAWATDATLDANGLPLGLELRREQLLRHTFRFSLDRPTRVGARLEIPVEIQNVGAGHRVPAGFSQERETWVELTVTDADGRVVYEVGKVAGDDADLRDKIFTRINTRDDSFDFKGRPLGVFGADIVDGPDVPLWDPNPTLGGTTFRGKGLVNLQNGFLRCVKCIGRIDAQGRCQPVGNQGRTRADRYDDGLYDIDTGECRSNLTGPNAFLETYFPVGALDAERGVAKAPDAILDTRSAAPGTVLRYTYELDLPGARAPFTIRARLRFRPFPPYLLRAFVDYETRMAAQGQRPSGAQITNAMIRRNKIIELASATAEAR